MVHLENEIAEQPAVIRRLLADQAAPIAEIADAIHRFQPVFACIAGRGTSDNAARYAQYLLQTLTRLPVALATPSVHTLYNAPPDLSRALVIGISQSGQALDVLQVLTDAREQGALTLTITNDPTSPLAQAAAYHLPIGAGEEISIAATKTYTAQLTAVAMLVAALVGSAEMHDALNALPDQVAETLTLSESVATWAEQCREIQQFAAVGRGYNYCTAFEISLKIKELCSITGHGYSEADFLHGPIAMVQPGFPVFIVAPSGITLPVMFEFLTKLRERKAEMFVISDDPTVAATAPHTVTLPVSPEWLTPITAVVPGQLFAMRLAQAKGLPVDRPHGLTKVTLTL